MSFIKNPIIPGMAPDPSIIRVDEDYYIATSTFHWQPAIQLFHSTDLVNWTLIDYALKANEVTLIGTNTPAGVWAPHLSYDSLMKKYWLTYSHMQNMAGREFNADSYTMYADSIHGPWSEPIYLTSIGFDTALYHDETGKHYMTTLEWESRSCYQAPGHIVVAEIELPSGKMIRPWKRVSQGFTTRGCVEAPQIYKRKDYYYLLLASGGTGYAHGVEVGRSKSIFGPYEPHPSVEPIVTSSPNHLFSLGDPDAGHFECYNPHSILQKSGHGSLVETKNGEWFLAHLMSRPLPDERLNPLGRETSIQKMRWTEDNWLEMDSKSNLAQEYCQQPASSNVEQSVSFDILEHFENERYDLSFMTPYHAQNEEWVKLDSQGQCLRIHGRNSLFSQMTPSILATRATSFHYDLLTDVEFRPDHYSETAGLGLYYDSNNWIYFYLTFSEQEQAIILTIMQAKLGEKIEFIHDWIKVINGFAELKISYHLGFANFYYRLNKEEKWSSLSNPVDVRYLSDEGVNGEPGEIGGFTGLFNFIGSVDAHQHDSFAEFYKYEVKNQ